MTDNDQSWVEYRRLVVDWHNEDKKDHERFDASLTAIHKTLIEMKTERRFAGWAAGVLVPAIVALISVGVAHAWGW